MKLTHITQKIVQGLGVAIVLGTHFGPSFTNPETKTYIELGVAVATAITGVLGQYTNPDGTHAKDPWIPPSPPLGKIPNFPKYGDD